MNDKNTCLETFPQEWFMELVGEELDRVKEIVRERAESHGNAQLGLADAASRWSVGQDTTLGPVDVCLNMVDLKLSRIRNRGLPVKPDDSIDDWTDIIGYAALALALGRASNCQPSSHLHADKRLQVGWAESRPDGTSDFKFHWTQPDKNGSTDS